jgi:hypothetical protein
MSVGNIPGQAQGMAAPEQPELPAWLETLRSGEPPATSAGGNAGAPAFSSADLVDEGMLPSWMRPERAEQVDNSPSGPYPARRPASAPAPDTDGSFLPTKGMAASSLIDEQFLPPWMQGQQEAPRYPGQENISAASLVQPGALPDWLKGMDPQATPGPVQYPQATYTAQAGQPIAANDLIDQQSLPTWMAGQNTPPPGNGQGFAASSLLDAHALPTWLREENQDQRNKNVEPAQPAQSAPSPYYQAPSGQGQAPNMQNTLAAASFIDANALPSWLRSAEGQPQDMASSQPQQGFAENLRQATFGVPPRPDTMRVPGRPRGEMGYLEESEVAANTFASMLGVASVAPNFPGQQPNDAYGYPQYQQSMPQQQAYTAAGMSGPGVPPGSIQGQPGQAAAGMLPNQGYAPNQAQSPAGYQAGYQTGNMSGASEQSPMAHGMAGNQPGAPTNNNPSNAQKKPARRGFLSTILDWFSFSH